MRDVLVAMEVEIDPFFRASSLRTAQQLTVKAPRGGKIIDRKGEMEGRQGHSRGMSLRA
jgi:hypothetical protein